jgi:hypothetical protein
LWRAPLLGTLLAMRHMTMKSIFLLMVIACAQLA